MEMSHRFGGTIYWIITFITGVIIMISPDILGGKFKTTESDHIIIGGIMVSISSIILIWKTYVWTKEEE